MARYVHTVGELLMEASIDNKEEVGEMTHVMLGILKQKGHFRVLLCVEPPKKIVISETYKEKPHGKST